MTDFYIKVPDEKTGFFKELIKNLGFEYEQLFSNSEEVPGDDVATDEEFFYVDSDD
ncbi:MAG: hypothetical protein ACERKD_19375 [Prolixibacteraceae bacterium]